MAEGKTKFITQCRGCGQRIYSGADEMIRVSLGTLHDAGELEEFSEESGVWGYMHHRCFLLAIRDPAAIDMVG